MSINLLIVLLTPIIGIYSLLIGFGVITPKKALEKGQDDIAKFRKSQKLIGFVMIILFALNLFKFININA